MSAAGLFPLWGSHVGSMGGVQLGSEPCCAEPCSRGTEATVPQNVPCSEQARQEGKQCRENRDGLSTVPGELGTQSASPDL